MAKPQAKTILISTTDKDALNRIKQIARGSKEIAIAEIKGKVVPKPGRGGETEIVCICIAGF